MLRIASALKRIGVRWAPQNAQSRNRDWHWHQLYVDIIKISFMIYYTCTNKEVKFGLQFSYCASNGNFRASKFGVFNR